MKYAIVYNSVTGNTKMLAETVKNELSEDDLLYYGPSDDKALEADKIYLGFWTDEGVCDKATGEFIKKLTNQEVFLFGTAGADGRNNGYFDTILEKVEKLLPKTVKVCGKYMCQGKMPDSIKQVYLNMKKKNPNDKSVDVRLDNFNKALSHPDTNDLEGLKNKIKE